MFSELFVCIALLSSAILIQVKASDIHPNVIIMTVNDLHWSDLGIHVNQKDSENSTPNLDYLAYSGIIMNRFYANGGMNSLLSGCYQRSQYGNKNLMSLYFERNGYKVNFMAHSNYDKIEAFEQRVLDAITNDNLPFLLMLNFGQLGDDVKIPFIDEIVGSIVTKAHQNGILNNTFILFLSLPDNDDDSSTIESNIRRTAFVYSPLLKHQQRISNQLFHVNDILPTLINATNLKWKTRDRIFIDGINQWPTLNTNDEQRLSVYGDNFYISKYWKLTFGTLSNYESLDNENMESDKDMNGYDFTTYIKSIFSSEVHLVLDELSSEKIMFLRSRAKVHCNLKDIEESAVKNIRCSHSTPCLFDLSEDPCEFDNKYEAEYDLKRDHMKETLERYLNGEDIDEIAVKNVDEHAEAVPEEGDSWKTGIILGGSVFGVFLILIIIVCVKENCYRKRSVYHNKTNKTTFVDQSDAKMKNGSTTNGNKSRTDDGRSIEVAVISGHH